MVWAEDDAIGLGAFLPWRQGGEGVSGGASRGQAPFPPGPPGKVSQRLGAKGGGYGDFLQQKNVIGPTNAMDAIGVTDIPSWGKAWKSGQVIVRSTGCSNLEPSNEPLDDPARIASAPKSGSPVDMSSMRSLVGKACEALGKDVLDGEHWLQVLERQWITQPAQLRSLSNAEWTQLNLPCGLRNELRVVISQMEAPAHALQRSASAVLTNDHIVSKSTGIVHKPNGVSQIPQAAPKPRPQSATSRLQRPIRQPREAKDLKPSARVRRVTDVEMIRKELQQSGGQWGPKLRKALVRNERVSLDFLRAALQSVGIKHKTDPELHSLMRAADPGGSAVPSLVLGREVLRVLAGSLNVARLAIVSAVYRSLDGDGSGAVPLAIIRRRFVATEHPDVKNNRIGAREILQQTLSQWKGRQGGVDTRSFVAMHEELSLAVATDHEFACLLHALWSCHPDEGILPRRRSSTIGASHSDTNRPKTPSRTTTPQPPAPLPPSLPPGEMPRLNQRRAKVVRDTFNSLDQDNSGRVSIEFLSARFLPDRHPDVLAHRLPRHEVLQELLRMLSRSKNRGFITEAEFVAYYEEVSAQIDRDEYFQRVVEMPWGFMEQAGDVASRNRRLGLEGKIRHTEHGLVGF